MDRQTISHYRIANQRIFKTLFDTPGAAVRRLGAVQAQDYLGALWAIGLRCRDCRESDVEKSLSGKAIVRTWPLRGTLHFVAAEDARWMLELSRGRVIAGMAGRCRQLGLAEDDFSRARKLFVKALRGGNRITRDGMFEVLKKAGISPAGQRGFHILHRVALDGVICFGLRKGKQHTFVLLDEWLAPAKNLSRDEAIAELARRYFTCHGPATLQDFAWWSGLSAADARAGLEAVQPLLAREKAAGGDVWLPRDSPAMDAKTSAACLLPAFDEFLVGYKDRSASIDGRFADRIKGLLSPTVLSGGKIIGKWGRTLETDSVAVAAEPFGVFAKTQLRSLAAAAKKYGQFLGKSVTLA
jgi:hypothetical protein